MLRFCSVHSRQALARTTRTRFPVYSLFLWAISMPLFRALQSTALSRCYCWWWSQPCAFDKYMHSQCIYRRWNWSRIAPRSQRPRFGACARPVIELTKHTRTPWPGECAACAGGGRESWTNVMATPTPTSKMCSESQICVAVAGGDGVGGVCGAEYKQ